MDFPKFILTLKEKILARPVFFLLLITIIVRLFYLLLNYPLWWDSHIYLAMGKFFFSQGQRGTFESFRPPLWPLLLGLLGKLNLNLVLLGKILDVLFSTFSVYLTYLLGKKIFSENTALLSAFIFSFNPIFIMHSGLILTEPLAISMELAGIYFFLLFLETEKFWKLFLSGIFLGLSFLSKFPLGILFFSTLIILVIKKNNWLNKIKSLFILSFGFFMIVLPDLLFNYFYLHSLFGPFISGNWIVGTTTWLYGSGLSYYFLHFFLKNPLTLLFFPALYFFFKEKSWRDLRKTLLVLILLLTFLYFLYVPRKEPRYLVTILPFLALLGTEIIYRTAFWLRTKPQPVIREKSFFFLCFLLLLLPCFPLLNFERTEFVPLSTLQFFQEQTEKDPNLFLLSSNPELITSLQQRVILLGGLEFASQTYEFYKNRTEFIFLNSCDFPCSPEDGLCQQKKEQFLEKVAQENKELFRKEIKKCTAWIYQIKNKG